MNNNEFERLLLSVQKPARYTGGEIGSIVKSKENISIRFAFCFPDVYEVGMSHLGMKILYSLFNEREDIWCERVFAPWTDFEEVMRREQIPLFALESRDPIKEFDFIGFTLQYEMSYTNVLNMLDLAGVPIHSADRAENDPIVVAGGPCACNPEPLADFIDIFFLGDGEEVDLQVMDLYKTCKASGVTRKEFLIKAAQIRGVYVPSLYNVDYNADGTIKAVTPSFNAPEKIQKCIIGDMNAVYYPKTMIVPYLEIIHDRVVQEVFRGCIRGCRFCQAGYLYRPVREKSADVVNAQARALCESTGYDELSLSSLSTSDYSELQPLLTKLLEWTDESGVTISLPSLRIDNFPKELLEKISHVRKSGLTFAPEAGTQRLRDVINKNITEDEIISTCKTAFEGGHTSVKLYFMLGLPTETDDDLIGITKLGQKIVNLYYSLPNKPKGKAVDVSISVSTFVPKAFTPFQFEPQVTIDEIRRKQNLLKLNLTTRKITLNWHESGTSFLEAVFARGDRRLGKVLETAVKLGCKFDGWQEHFSLDKWLSAFKETEVDPAFYANRIRSYEEIMPWDHLDYFISKEFLIRENKAAKNEITTPNCREKCSGCGVAVCKEGICVEKHKDSI